MKSNMWLCSVILATSSMMTVAHADNTARVAATSALGSIVGTAVGKQLGGNTGAMIGSAIGGAGGAAASSNRRDRTEAAIGAGLGGVGGYTVVIWAEPMVVISVLRLALQVVQKKKKK